MRRWGTVAARRHRCCGQYTEYASLTAARYRPGLTPTIRRIGPAIYWLTLMGAAAGASRLRNIGADLSARHMKSAGRSGGSWRRTGSDGLIEVGIPHGRRLFVGVDTGEEGIRQGGVVRLIDADDFDELGPVHGKAPRG